MNLIKSQTFDTSLNIYLNSMPLKEKLYLSPCESLSFHWADWPTTCRLMRELSSDQTQQGMYQTNLDDIFDSLTRVPVWLKKGMDTLQVSLYDIYLAYLDPKLRLVWFENDNDSDSMGQMFVSTVSENGPYIPLNSMRWFVKDIFLNFVYAQILGQNVLERKFRLRLNKKVKCQFVYDDYEVEESLQCQQITGRGLLFRMSSIGLKPKLKRLRRIEIPLNLDGLNRALHSQGDQFLMRSSRSLVNLFRPGPGTTMYRLESYNFGKSYGVKLEGRYCALGEAFLFIPFDKVSSQRGAIDLGETLLPIMQRFEQEIQTRVG